MAGEIQFVSRDLITELPLLTRLTQDRKMGRLIWPFVLPEVTIPTLEFKFPTFLAGQMDRRTAINMDWVPGEYPKLLTFDRGFNTAVITPSMIDAVVPIEEVYRGRAFGFDPRADLARRITTAMDVYREFQMAEILGNTTPDVVYPSDHIEEVTSSSDKWDHTDANGVYDVDVRLQIEALSDIMNERVGVRPNTAITSEKVMRVLRRNKVLRGYIGGIGNVVPDLTNEQVASVLGFDRILVGDNYMYKPGEASLSATWGPFFSMIYVEDPSRASTDTLSFGYMVRSSMYPEAGRIQTYRSVDRGNQEYLRRMEVFSPKVFTGACGAIIHNVLTS